MIDQHIRQLDDEGYVVLESAMPDGLLSRLRSRILELFEEEGENAGREFRGEEHAHRLANLVDKGEVFREAIALPHVLQLVRHVLGGDGKLSSLNARSADPHTDVGQPLHVDMGAIPDEKGYWVCNTVWLLDDFTRENGPTRMIPGSHRWGTKPQDVLDDPLAPHPHESHIVAAAGDARVLLSARQAAAAVSETVAAAGSAGGVDAGAPPAARGRRSVE
jgi:ectoine hydroxylase-related dioxygenase (phytanoyl-CoA dioxygenase family)